MGLITYRSGSRYVRLAAVCFRGLAVRRKRTLERGLIVAAGYRCSASYRVKFRYFEGGMIDAFFHISEFLPDGFFSITGGV